MIIGLFTEAYEEIGPCSKPTSSVLWHAVLNNRDRIKTVRNVHIMEAVSVDRYQFTVAFSTPALSLVV